MRSVNQPASVNASVQYRFNRDRAAIARPHIRLNRAAALAEWRGLTSSTGRQD
jgi:putative transposase